MGLSGRMEDTALEWGTEGGKKTRMERTKMILSGESQLQLQLGDLPVSTEQENNYLRRMFSFTLKN